MIHFYLLACHYNIRLTAYIDCIKVNWIRNVANKCTNVVFFNAAKICGKTIKTGCFLPVNKLKNLPKGTSRNFLESNLTEMLLSRWLCLKCVLTGNLYKYEYELN